MTPQGSFTGDILVQDRRIVQIGKGLALPDGGCVLDAAGLTILPGMIDPHIHEGPETDEHLLHSPQAAGVTAGLLWPEEEGTCRILTADAAKESRIHTLQPGLYTDAQLHERLLYLANEGFRVACQVHSAEECRRILHMVHSTRVKIILVHLVGCEELMEAIALSGCPVVLGVSGSRTSSPWKMVCRLNELGVQAAVTCNWPAAKLCHLPLCAALCAREGMERQRCLHLVTTAPAGLLGLSDAGRIESGCRADFAIYDGDPLLLATSHVMTISGGKMRH